MTNKKPTYQELEEELSRLKKEVETLRLSDLHDKISDAKHSKMIGNIGDVIVIINEDEINTYKSPNIEQLFGWKPEELVGQNTWDVIHPDDLEENREFIAMLKSKPNTTGSTELRYKCKDGTFKWIRFTGTNLIHDPDIRGILGNYHDITKRRNAEESIRKSEEKFRIIADNTYNWEFWEAADGNFIYHSPSCKKFTGFSPDELQGDRDLFLGVIHPEDRNGYVQHHIHTSNERASGKHYFRIIDAKDEIRYIEHLCQPVYDENNAFLGIRGTNLDITDRRLVEDALKHEQLFIEKIIESLPGIFYLYTYPQLRLVRWNKNHETLLGFTAGEIANRHLMDWHIPEAKAAVQEAVDYVMAVGQNILESPLMSKEGKYIPFLMTGASFATAEQRYLMGIGIDITERRMHEQEIAAFNEELTATTDALRESNTILEEAKERAEESDRLKTAFLANVSHEIRTPMNGILGFADLLKEPKLTGEEQQKYIGIIEKSGARMLNIINDLVNISKVESGQMEVSYSKTNINEQLDFLFNFFETEANLKGLEFSMKCPLPLEKATINTDREKLYAILTNLIKNAIKFTRQGEVNFGYEVIGDMIEFYVKDTGIGIPLNKQVTVFDRFSQVDSGLASGYEGAGLGLSISKAYVEMLGGKIRIESEEGKGAKVFFTIPGKVRLSVRNANENLELIRNKENGDMSTKILIAEDDEGSLMYLSILLENSGFNLIMAGNGQEAVEMCHSHPDINIVLMDIKMPIMDGHTAAKLIKEFRPELPIIAQTAYALEVEKEKFSLTFDGYVTKPVKARELKEKIAALTNRSKVGSA